MKKAKRTYQQVKEQIRKQQQQIAKEALEQAMSQEREEWLLRTHTHGRRTGQSGRVACTPNTLRTVLSITASAQVATDDESPQHSLLSIVCRRAFPAQNHRGDGIHSGLSGYRQVADFEVVVADGEQKDCYRELLERLRQRGLKHVEVIVTDGLPGLDEVIAEVFPGAQHQLCVLYMLRQWLAKVRKQDRKRVSNLLRQMLIEADDPQHAHQLLQTFVQQYGRTYPSIVRSLQQRFQALTVHLRYPPEIRRLIYTNNPVESLFRQMRRFLAQSTVPGAPQSSEPLLVMFFNQMNLSYRRRRVCARLNELLG